MSTFIQHIINGKKVDSRDTFETVNPATGEVLDTVASGGAREVIAAVAAAKAAFPGWAATPVKERARLVRKLGDLIAHNVAEIADMETADCGQVTNQTKRVLVPRAADNFYYFAELAQHQHGERPEQFPEASLGYDPSVEKCKLAARDRRRGLGVDVAAEREGFDHLHRVGVGLTRLGHDDERMPSGSAVGGAAGGAADPRPVFVAFAR